jgi:hypothetical protein
MLNMVVHIVTTGLETVKGDAYERLEVQVHSFIASALDGGKWPISHH